MAENLPKEPPSSEITPEALYNGRREWLRQAGFTVGTAALLGTGLHLLTDKSSKKGAWSSASAGPSPAGGSSTSANGAPSAPAKPATDPSATAGTPAASVPPEPVKPTAPKYEVPGEAQTSFEDIATYNNYYEFGTGKDEPAENAHTLKTSPWKIEVEGEVEKRTIDMDDIRKWFTVEDRVYRFRCVEAWSMVIPWQGFQLSHLIEKLNPTGKAKYVQFFTLADPEQMPGLKIPALKWPYREGLRMDEAMHPLTMMATGLYGKTLPNQNGAPIRLVVPWKYGFKYIKSIVKIRFTEKEPETSWKMAAPHEYGFYSNVNPEVDHPRWSQKSERRIGEFRRRATLKFNGYGEQVAALYKGMDLSKEY